MNYQPGGAKPAPPLPPALLMLEVFAMKAQAQSWVSDFQPGLPMPGADVPHLGAGQRLCPLCCDREEGQSPTPTYPALWPATSCCFLVGGHSGICIERAHVHTDPQTQRFTLGVARIQVDLGQHHLPKASLGWAEVTRRIW